MQGVEDFGKHVEELQCWSSAQSSEVASGGCLLKDGVCSGFS